MNSLTQVLLDIARTANQEYEMTPLRKCAYQGCGKEFLAIDPRAVFCTVHHMVFLGNLGAAVAAGKSPIDAVVDGFEEAFDKSDELDDSERHEELDPEISGQTGFEE